MNRAASRHRAVIVDANDDLRELFTLFLEHCGYDVRSAHTGALGLACAAEFAPDIVFSSLRVGDVDGYALARALRKLPQTAGCVLIAMSGFANEDRAVREAGFDHYLRKPISLDDITAILKPLDDVVG